MSDNMIPELGLIRRKVEKMIKTERIYEATKGVGFRILVDRLWPRGLRKDEAGVDLWLKDIGPSNELRKWFGHDPARWDEFRERFFKELDSKNELVEQIVAKVQEGDVVLLFGAKDEVHNNAVALKDYIESKMKMRNRGSLR
jgi:uncharacterized protein YeaO (DUF488 family)